MLLDRARRFRRRRLRRLERLAFYRQFVAPGDLCFDVGANVGNRTGLFLALGARVVAVEPQAWCAEQLRRRFMRRGFPAGRRLTVVESALGPEPGTARLRLAPSHTVATLSSEWVERVREAGRFDFAWDGGVDVPVTTLDALIEAHGVPAFCKIDVEGYEPEVLAGLSAPIHALSFEFTPEYLDATEASANRLLRLGDYEFNYSLGESLVLESPRRWLSADQLLAALASLGESRPFGDVYARLGASEWRRIGNG